MTAHSRRQTKTRPVPAPCCARNNNPEGHALCGPLYIYRSDIQSRKLLLLGIDPPRQKRNCSRSAAPLLVSKQRGCKPTAREIAPTEQYIISPFCNEMFVNGASSPQTAMLFKLEYALFTFGSSPLLADPLVRLLLECPHSHYGRCHRGRQRSSVPHAALRLMARRESRSSRQSLAEEFGAERRRSAERWPRVRARQLYCFYGQTASQQPCLLRAPA